MRPADPESGKRLGPYRLDREIGSGGMGKVYAATVVGPVAGLVPGSVVALKVLHQHLVESPRFLDGFRREAEIGRRVVHRNVVRTLATGMATVEGIPRHFLAAEYVDGQTLRDLLRELGRVPEELCLHIGREVGRALAAIHAEGIVHRDLKPENVLITKDHTVKVMDLGVARLTDEAMRLSQSGGFVGSVFYAAPEQFEGIPPDGRADWYALGLILYELATGQHPSKADDFASVMRLRLHEMPRPAGQANPQLSPYFEEVLSAFLARDREHRPAFFPEEESDWWRERALRIRRDTRRPLRRIRIPRETALYGRVEEIARLQAAFEKAQAGDGQAILVEGEAGIGKTRIVDEFVGSLGVDVNFLFGSYPPGGAATAAGAFSTAYREHFGEAGAAPWLAETPLLVPAFDALLRGEPAPGGAESLVRDSIQSSFAHATRALARERPTIVLVDDLHFAPEEGRALFASLSLALPGHRILLVGTARPGLPDDWVASFERAPHASRLFLKRLGAQEVGALLVDALGSERLAEELGYRILTKSDGNPFFVFEIIRGLREGHLIAQAGDGTWVRTQVIDRIEIPSSVLDLIRARMASLSEAECNLLDVASCCGFEFDPVLVSDVLGIAPIPALQTFGRIEKRHRLVRSAGRRYVFDHHQVQEALYEGLHEQLRERYHTALAEAMERRAPAPGAGAAAVDLTEHFLKGASGARALPYLDAALDHLEKGYLNESAVDLAARALAAPGLVEGRRRAEILLRENTRLDFLGRREEQRRALDEALAIAEQEHDSALSARVRVALGVLLARTASYEAARRELLAARDLHVRAGDRRGEAAATGSIGAVCLDLGWYEEGKAHLARYVALAHETGDRRAEMTAAANLGNACLHAGDYGAARTHYERSLALARELSDRRSEATAIGNLGNLSWRLGRLAEAREAFERHAALAREVGLRHGETLATGNLGNVYFEMGRIASAMDCYERHLHVAREIGARDSEVVALINLGVARTCLGRPGAAAPNLEAGLAVAQAIGANRLESYAIRGLADVALERGDTVAAERLEEQALLIRRKIGYRRGVAESLLALGRLRTMRRSPDAATILDEAIALARETDAADLLAQATAHRARLPGGDTEAAIAAILDSAARLGVFAAMDARFALFEATGERDHLAVAHDRLEEVRAGAPAEDRDALIANVSLHRRIEEAWKRPGP